MFIFATLIMGSILYTRLIFENLPTRKLNAAHKCANPGILQWSAPGYVKNWSISQNGKLVLSMIMWKKNESQNPNSPRISRKHLNYPLPNRKSNDLLCFKERKQSKSCSGYCSSLVKEQFCLQLLFCSVSRGIASSVDI